MVRRMGGRAVRATNNKGDHRTTSNRNNQPPVPFKRAEDVLYREENQSRVDPLAPANWWETRGAVYVLLFGVENRARTGEPEGIYSIKGCTHAGEGSPFDVIVAWECEEDAQRFATLLEAELGCAGGAAAAALAAASADPRKKEGGAQRRESCDDGLDEARALGTPTVRAIAPRDLRQFCWQAGHRVCVEPTGSLLLPARANVLQSDWERELALRRGQWSVLPEASGATNVERDDDEDGGVVEEDAAVVLGGGEKNEELAHARAELERLWALNADPGADGGGGGQQSTSE